MNSALQSMVGRLDQLSDQFRELRDGFHKAIDIANADPEMALTRARKVLEYVIRDVYERRIKEPPGTRPLENLLQRLVKDGFFPDRLDAYANTIRKLGNVGTHTFGEMIAVADVHQSLTQLMPILEWYFEVERPEALDGQAIQPQSSRPPQNRPTAFVAASPANIAIVPKGLRSFDAKDADFFLGLLPGARDKDGLPESIRFWKHRIEAGDEPAFAIGVLYGPSGCGKSSLVKAGLLPRLANHVASVYVEATAEDTEARLLAGLRRRFPGLSVDLSLADSIAALRQGTGLIAGEKLLVVLDQFEQWLHAHCNQQDTELAKALRQCDGQRVQCIVLVRDDFWVALSRFMDDLHIELLQNQNMALVDLFDSIHARKVLAAFGRAYGRLNESPSKEQDSFLDQVVRGLAQDGRVISVRLALFAEMVKGKPWTPATLNEVGGTEGVGVRFLEETFSAADAPAGHRYHQKAARAVLKVLSPESGMDIKGHMRSYAELLEASGYTERAKEFGDLIRILDGETRLITPTDSEGKERFDRSGSQSPPDQKYYQLTHDYLVPSLREWLTRKQKETRRGRAELLLADRATIWHARPENRQLPSLWQTLGIHRLTDEKNWTQPQKKMMQKAGRVHGLHAVVAALLLVVLIVGSREVFGRIRAKSLVDQLMSANIVQVPDIVKRLHGYRRWADPLLKQEEAEAKEGSRQLLHLKLALLPVDVDETAPIYSRLLDAPPDEIRVLIDALASHKTELLEKLWDVGMQSAQNQQRQSLRAASALAAYDPTGQRWASVQDQVANDLVRMPAVHLSIWMDILRPVREKLLAPLSVVFRDSNRSETERSMAADILADYAADQPQVLADLVMEANTNQFAVLFPKLKKARENGAAVLAAEVIKQIAPDSKDDAKEKLAKRQANAAVALLKLDQPEKIWPLLKHSPDPRARSYLINRLAPFGAEPMALVKRLDEEPDVTIQRALILSLGEFGEHEFPLDARKTLLPKLQDIYCSVADPGLHAAAEWLLRSWKQEEWLNQVKTTWAKDPAQREKATRAASARGAKPQWSVNQQGQTIVLIPGPVEFLMGSPSTEGGSVDERQHKERIGRTFAIAAKPVTVGEYRRFDESYKFAEQYAPTPDCPVVGTSWYQAAAYCNWLSKQDGIDDQKQWCYETDSQGRVVKLKDKYLSLMGYRLPTGAEMEYATRAGALTRRYFGEAEELLPKYAWYEKNFEDRTWPPGIKKPNDLGLFDMHGDVWCWCQERYKPYPQSIEGKPSEDVEDILSIDNQDGRVLRGGSFGSLASLVRSAYRLSYVPADHSTNTGFRAARTLSVVP